MSTRDHIGRPAALGGAAVVAVAGLATAAALGVVGTDGGGAPAANALPPATAEVTRTTLAATTALEGTLGYGEQVTVSANRTGILTWLPEPGSTVSRGDRVYAVDAEPVVLLYGAMPFYRPLGEGDRGIDVAQLEENLSALGYQGFTVDDEYTWATAEVVAQWQDDLGVAGTGRFDPARAVVAPDPVRIAEHRAGLGGVATGAVLSYTGTTQRVTVDLAVTDRPLVTDGMAATVELPDGTSVPATVTRVGAVATAGGDESTAPGGEEAPATVEVVATAEDPEQLGGWEAAPVEVLIETDRREDVLAVPVGALVALAEGGYGVQVVQGDGTSYVAVETGMFADGLVEISGDGITEGTTVGVPS